MEHWQIFVSFCAGLVTVITLIDKIGLTKKVKYHNDTFSKLVEILPKVIILNNEFEKMSALQGNQNQALLAILRNELYRCFKENREFGAWTDSECEVQTKIHEAYKSLKGNGTEQIWWEKKQLWRIVSDEEFHDLIKARNSVI